MSTLVSKPLGSAVNNRRDVALPRFSSWIENFFDENIGTGFLSNFNTGMTLPAVNIMEDAESFALEIAVPGMEKSDFNIDIDNKILSISSDKEMDTEENVPNYTRREFGYSTFTRTFTLPDTVNSERINATYKDGILRVDLPKKDEAKQKPARRIDIS